MDEEFTGGFFTDSLNYHSSFPAGKIGTALTKPVDNQDDLSLTYTPGVGSVCMAISEQNDEVWKYTNRANTVAIVTDGTAVLGLGNIGPEAALPVMEGKSVLFKKFADIDSYPLCMKFEGDDYIDDFRKAVKCLEPCLAGVNIEDVKAPECFELQEDLERDMGIPVFHDDQDGTGIIIIAGIINALKLKKKEISDTKILINGAGAAGIACARLLLHFGFDKAQIYLCDSKGLVTTSREVNKYKAEFAQGLAEVDLAEAIKGKDIFIGVSVRNVLNKDMVKSMNPNPIIFAVANPIPEIMPEDAIEAGAFVVGTGRSDYPNQVNNSVGFPGIFRAALDTRSTVINQAMKIAASKALASLVGEPVNDGFVKEILVQGYPFDAEKGFFDSDNPICEEYVIPKQLDLRVVPRVARMVAQAAMETDVATFRIDDLDVYEKFVFDRIKHHWVN